MRETGFVKSVSGDLCEVVVSRKSACGENCASCRGACKMKKQVCTAKNEAGAEIGDHVIIEMDSTKILKSAFLVYIFPLLIFLGIFCATAQMYSQMSATIFATAAAVIVFICLHFFDKKHKSEYLSRVLEII